MRGPKSLKVSMCLTDHMRNMLLGRIKIQVILG